MYMKHENLETRASAFLAKRQKRNRWIALVTVMCLVVVGLTIDITHREAVTMERIPSCGIEEHVHSEACYTRQYDHEAYDPIYGTVPVYVGNFSVHQHTEECYDWEGNLNCGYRENAYFHTHNQYCYDENGNLVCGLEEIPVHEHTEECFVSYPVLSCGLNDGDGAHVHTEACYSEVRSTIPNCGLEESAGHVHSADCYARILSCGQIEGQGHVHTDACYTPNLTCELAENPGHVHTKVCYAYEPVCGMEENAGHVHSADCYTRMMTCGMEIGDGAHAHTESCYEDVVELICGQEEGDSHTHSAECYAVVHKLTCGQVENGGHVHTDACFEDVLTCGLEEGTGAHIHDESCFGFVLVCGMQEGEGAHIHDANCYTYILSCGQEEGEGVHVHTDACYSDTLICEIPEGTGAHMHTEECYPLIWQVTCGQEENSGHVHTDACYTWKKDTVCEYANVHVHTEECWSYDMLGRKICICGMEEIPVFETTPLDWRYDEVLLDPGHVHDESCSYIDVLTCDKAEHIHTDSCYQVIMTRVPTETGAPENNQNPPENVDVAQGTIPEDDSYTTNGENDNASEMTADDLSTDEIEASLTDELSADGNEGTGLSGNAATDSSATPETVDPFSGLSEESIRALGLGEPGHQENVGDADTAQKTTDEGAITSPEETTLDSVTEIEETLSSNEGETSEDLTGTGMQITEENSEDSSAVVDAMESNAEEHNSTDVQEQNIDTTLALVDSEEDEALSAVETGAQTYTEATGDNSVLIDETADTDGEKDTDFLVQGSADINEVKNAPAVEALNIEGEEQQSLDATESEENDKDSVSDGTESEKLSETEEENSNLTASIPEDEATEKTADDSSLENADNKDNGIVLESEEDTVEADASDALKDEEEQGEKSALSDEETEKADADDLLNDEDSEVNSETTDASVTDEEPDTDSEKTDTAVDLVSSEDGEVPEEEHEDTEKEADEKDNTEPEENGLGQNGEPLVLGMEDLIVVPLTAEDAEIVVSSLQMEGTEPSHFMAWNLHLLDEALQAEKYEVHMDLPVSVEISSGEKLEAILYTVKNVINDEGEQSAVISEIEAEILFDEEGRAISVCFETDALSTFVLRYEVHHSAQSFEAEIVLSESGDIDLNDTADVLVGNLQLSDVWADYGWSFQESTDGISVNMDALSVIHVQESGSIIFATAEEDTLTITVTIKEDTAEEIDTVEASIDLGLTWESLPSSDDVSEADIIASPSDILEVLEEIAPVTEEENNVQQHMTFASESDLREVSSAVQDNEQSQAEDQNAVVTAESSVEQLTDDLTETVLASETNLADVNMDDIAEGITEDIVASMTDMDSAILKEQETFASDVATQTDLSANVDKNAASGAGISEILQELDGFTTLELDHVTITPLGEKEFPADAEGYASLISDTESLEVAIEEYLQDESAEESDKEAKETKEEENTVIETKDLDMSIQMPSRMMKSAARMTVAQNTIEGKAAFSLNNDTNVSDDETSDTQSEEDAETDVEESEQKTGNVKASKLEQKRYVAFDIGLNNVQINDYDGFHVNVTLPQSIQGKNFVVYHIHEGNVSLVENLELHGTSSEDVWTVEGFSFDTPNFSEFVLSYTVDFSYEGIDYSIPGNSQILASELFSILKVTCVDMEEADDLLQPATILDVKDVAEITFTDEHLVKVEQVSGLITYNDGRVDVGEKDFLLTSLEPFTSEEKLTIKLLDGREIVVNVTDAVSTDMKDALAVITINGSADTNQTIRPDEEYRIHLEFNEIPNEVQFPTTGNDLVYAFPSSFQPVGSLNNEPILLSYVEDGVAKTLTGCSFSAVNGNIVIHLTDEAKQKLAVSGDGVFKLDIVGKFSNPGESIDWGGDHIWAITWDDSKSLSTTKSGKYDSATNKVNYSINVSSTGTNTGVNVHDQITGTALTLNHDVVVKDASGKVINPQPAVTYNDSQKTFDLTLPDMNHKDRYTIEYSASVNWDNITGNGTAAQTGNSVTVKDNPAVTHTLENNINYNPLDKSVGNTISDPNNENIKYVQWTVKINEAQLRNMAGTVFTDHINSSIMTYTDYNGQAGILVRKYDGNSLVGSDSYLSWVNVGVNDFTSDKSWTYTIPDESNTNYRYEFTYWTKVDVSTQNGNTAVQNYVSDEHYHQAQQQTTVEPGTGKIEIDKQIVGTPTRENMSWSITLTVPPQGLNKAVLTDYLPKIEHSGYKFNDTLKADSIHVSGLQDGIESYKIRETDDKFIITFYKDLEQTSPGLNGTSVKRTITVTFQTENNQDWITLLRDQWHVNNAKFEGDNASVTDYDQGNVAAKDFSKNGKKLGFVELPKQSGTGTDRVLVFEYTLDIYGLKEEDFNNDSLITIVDDYSQHKQFVKFYDIIDGAYNSTNVLQCEDGTWMDGTWAQRIQNGYRNVNQNGTRIHPVDNNTDGTLTFTLPKSAFPLDNEGQYLSRYQIIYYMVVKDATAQTALENFADEQSDRTAHLTNTATWNDLTDDATVDYTNPVLKKEHIAPSVAPTSGNDPLYNPDTGMTGFKITIDLPAKQLNNGNDLTLTDVFSGNLSVDYSSIKVTVNDVQETDSNRTIVYDYKGNTGTFTIPDTGVARKIVIEYDAKVIGQPGQWVQYGNTVTMNGYKDGVTGYSQLSGSGEGGFNINSIRIYKYEANNMTKPIQGVTFTLVDENGDPVLYTTKSVKKDAQGNPVTPEVVLHNIGDHVTYTTGADGYAEIKPSEEEDGFSLQKGITYYLRETGTPIQYAVNNTTYRFTLSDNPNYPNYEYHSGDIMKIYNWPVKGRLEIKKTIVGGPQDMTEEDKKRITFEIKGYYDAEMTKPVKLDEWGYAVTENNATENMDNFVLNISYADFSAAGSYMMEDLLDGYYTVEEKNAALPGYQNVTTTIKTYEVTKGTNNSIIIGNEISGAVNGNTATVEVGGDKWREIDVTNNYETPKGTEIKIKKVNGSTALYGARFKLEKKNPGSGEYEIYTDSSVDDNGLFTIAYDNRNSGVRLTNLVDGEYRITEVKAPTNYKITGDGAFEFTVADGQVSGPETRDGRAEVTYESTNTLFTVENDVKHNYAITKVDGANVSLKLGGAQFGVFEHVPGNTIEQDRSAAKNGTLTRLYTYVTDENGWFEILVNDNNSMYDDAAHYYKNVSGSWVECNAGDAGAEAHSIAYFIMEVKAPEGYSLPDNPDLYYYYFGTEKPINATQIRALGLADSRRSATITNDLIDLKVQKIWKTLENQDLKPDDVDEIEFALYQTATTKNVETGAVISTEEKQYPDDETLYKIEKDSSNNWPVLTIGSLPASSQRTGDTKVYYTYRVEEIVPDGYEVAYTTEDNGRRLVMRNRPESTHIDARKEWSENTPDALKLSGSFSFKLQRKLKTDSSSDWVDIPNSTKSLTKWNGSANVPVNEDWTVTWTDLSVDYDYRVVEIISSNADRFDVSYSEDEDGTLVVTNTYKSTEISAQKIWSDNTPEEKKNFSLRFQLWYKNKSDTSSEWAKYGSDVSVTVYDGSKSKNVPVMDGSQTDSNKWTATINNWKVTWGDLSTDNIYKVTEILPSDQTDKFDVTYSDNNADGIEGGEITVTNTYNKTFIDVKKIWKDAESGHAGINVYLYQKSETYPAGRRVQKNNQDVQAYLSSEPYEYRFDELPKYDENGKEWSYYVQEDYQGVTEGHYVVSYSNDKDTALTFGVITITNEKIDENKLAVKKLWLDSDGNPIDPPAGTESISVQLKKIAGVPSPDGTSVTAEFQRLNWNGEEVVGSASSTAIIKANSTFVIGFEDAPDTDKVTVTGGTIIGAPFTKGIYTAYRVQATASTVTITAKKINHWRALEPVFLEKDQELLYDDPVSVGEAVELKPSNNWAYKWNDITAAENEKYFIEEITPVPGFITQYENNYGIRTGIIYVKNVESQTGSLSLSKTVTADQDLAVPDGTYTFTVQKINEQGEDVGTSQTVSITFTGANATSATGGSLEGNIVTLSNLEPGWYKISEAVPTNGTALTDITVTNGAAYSQGTNVQGNVVYEGDPSTTKPMYAVVYVEAGNTPAEAQATFTNTLASVDIEVNKAWAPVTTWPSDVESVTVQLQKAEYDLDKGAYLEFKNVNGKTLTITSVNSAVTSETVAQAEGAEKAAKQALLDQRFFYNLPKYDSKGYEIKYKVVESDVTGTNVKVEDFTVSYSSEETTTSGLITVTNTAMTSFNFNKIWLDPTGNVAIPASYQNWKENITVTIKRRPGLTGDADANFILKYTISKSEDTFTATMDTTESKLPEAEGNPNALTLKGSGTSNVFNFTLPDKSLRKYNDEGTEWVYYVVESEVPLYVTSYWAVVTGDSGTTYAETLGAKDAKDGGVIVNQTFGGYELPSTGGPGNTALYLLGSMLIMLAGAGFILLSREKRSRVIGSSLART